MAEQECCNVSMFVESLILKPLYCVSTPSVCRHKAGEDGRISVLMFSHWWRWRYCERKTTSKISFTVIIIIAFEMYLHTVLTRQFELITFWCKYSLLTTGRWLYLHLWQWARRYIVQLPVWRDEREIWSIKLRNQWQNQIISWHCLFGI